MNWFIVVYFLVNGEWIEADKLKKEGWSKIEQPNYSICIKKINETNSRFKKIAESKNTKLDIKFKCECRENLNNLNNINCKERNWFQKIWDKLYLLN
ncbi:MAG: hypothetical protein CMI95_00560 [Pelagibacteraceae bacterium]|nr:hypothetical protein [Pelagibacteraceae bacterium]|tara:strand:+ start:404 stop:694 length:291 start_codon:yes stop_codon:yes gene_type:complete